MGLIKFFNELQVFGRRWWWWSVVVILDGCLDMQHRSSMWIGRRWWWYFWWWRPFWVWVIINVWRWSYGREGYFMNGGCFGWCIGRWNKMWGVGDEIRIVVLSKFFIRFIWVRWRCIFWSKGGWLVIMMRFMKGFIWVNMMFRCGCLANMKRIVKGFNGIILRIGCIVGNKFGWRGWLFIHITCWETRCESWVFFSKQVIQSSLLTLNFLALVWWEITWWCDEILWGMGVFIV